MNRTEQHEQLLVLGGTEPVHQHSGPRCALRALGQQRLGQQSGKVHRGHPVDSRGSGFAVDAQTEVHGSVSDREQGFGPAGERASGKGGPEGRRRLVRGAGKSFDLVDAVTSVGGGAGDLEDREVTGDAAPELATGGCSRCDVVGDEHGAAVGPLRPEALLGCAEVHHVAGVVAERHQDAGPTVEGAADTVDLFRRR